MHRFFENSFPDIVSEENKRHIKVLRISPQEHIEVSTPEGVYICTQDLNEYSVIKKLDENRDSSSRLKLYFGALKGTKNDEVLRHCTEIGVDEFAIVCMDRSIVDYKSLIKKFERWEKIIESAAKQSKRSNIPKLEILKSCDEIEDRENFSVCYEETGKNYFTKEMFKPSIKLLIGPEGGISKREISLFKDANFLGLGDQILRAETASIAMSFYIKYGSVVNAKDI